MPITDHKKKELQNITDETYIRPREAARKWKNLLEITHWMKEALNENEDFCSMERLRYLTKIRVYIQEGKYERAYGLLQKCPITPKSRNGLIFI